MNLYHQHVGHELSSAHQNTVGETLSRLTTYADKVDVARALLTYGARLDCLDFLLDNVLLMVKICQRYASSYEDEELEDYLKSYVIGTYDLPDDANILDCVQWDKYRETLEEEGFLFLEDYDDAEVIHVFTS
jgi:hypothetical protein